MIFTLQRYIFRELLKVFVLSTVALTLMMSVGMILRPVQEYGIGPRQVLHLMFYFLPITLTFVLPLAALFAGSLVYGRFACDNELDACRASGISLSTTIYPGFVLALVVAIANLLLSFHVMPAFVQKADKSLKADAKQILFRNIQRRGFYILPSDDDETYMLYADMADPEKNTISGAVVPEVEEGRIKRIITAKHAKIEFISYQRYNEVQIMAKNVYQMGYGDEGDFAFEFFNISKVFPSLIEDSIKFKNIEAMNRIRTDPFRFNPIANLASDAYLRFNAELLADDMAEHFDSAPQAYYRLHSDTRIIEFRADACRLLDEENELLFSGDVEVVESDAASRVVLRTMRSPKAILSFQGDKLAPTLFMELYNPRWEKIDGTEGLAGRIVIRGLILPQAVTNQLPSENVIESVSPAQTRAVLGGDVSKVLQSLQEDLKRKIQDTLIRIKAEKHSRLVFGIGCLPMILIGIGLGITKKDSHLLAAFAASCIPAAILIVCIMMGKNMTKNPGTSLESGVLLIWSGLIFLILLTAVIYRKLLKT